MSNGRPLNKPKSRGARKKQGHSSAHLPDIQFLVEEEMVVEMADGPVHSVTISHLHHGSSWLALHKLHLKDEKEISLFQLSQV